MNESTLSDDSNGRSRNTALIVVAVAVAVGIGLAIRTSGILDLETVAAKLRDVGSEWWAPLAFLALYCLFNLFGLPGTVLTLTAGVIWGWLIGGLTVLAASTVATLPPYLIARRGAPAIETMVRARAGRLYDRLQREGFTALLLMRLLPLIPYSLLNYASGFARIGARDYVAATLIGTIPGVFIYTWFADAIADGLLSAGGAFLRVVVAGSALASLVVISRLLAARLRRDQR